MLKFKKVSVWKAILFSVIALMAALVIGYAVHAGNKAFPDIEESTVEISSNEETISNSTPEYTD